MDDCKMSRLPLLGLLFVILLHACNPATESVESRDNHIDFDTIQISESYLLDNKEGNPMCNLQVQLIYPATSDQYDVSSLESLFVYSILGQGFKDMDAAAALKKYSEMYIQNYRTDAETYRRDRPKQEEHSMYEHLYDVEGQVGELPEVFYTYSETIDNEIIYNKNGVIAYQVVQVNDKGGVATHEQVNNFTYNLEMEQWVNEQDIFEPGYDEALRPVIQELLMELHDVKTIEQLEDLGFFGVEEIIPNNNFLLMDEGIVYTFNKGEFSAYHLPPAQILIPYATIRSLLKEHSVIDQLSVL